MRNLVKVDCWAMLGYGYESICEKIKSLLNCKDFPYRCGDFICLDKIDDEWKVDFIKLILD